ncbi:MAG: hypothetical protein ACAI34_20580 [Verrucomicrobium sp.]|nr:hypothetical protein [Verrucomicrobium sp.]
MKLRSVLLLLMLMMLPANWVPSAKGEDVVKKYFTPVDPRPINLWNVAYNILDDAPGELARAFIRDGAGEQMISLSKVGEDQASLEYGYFSQSIVHALRQREPVNMTPKRVTKKFPFALAERLNCQWVEHLLRVAHPAEPPPLADGATIYHFYAYRQMRGVLSGQVRVDPCPENFEMIVAVNLMIAFANAESAAAENDILAKLENLSRNAPALPKH